jgi:kumamolisin
MNCRTIIEDSIMALPLPGSTYLEMDISKAGMQDMAAEIMLEFVLNIPEENRRASEDTEKSGRPYRMRAKRNPDNNYSAAVEQVSEWLTNEGYRIYYVSVDSDSIFATASASIIADSLEVEMVAVTSSNSRYTSARTAPSVPDFLEEIITTIVGLQPFIQGTKHLMLGGAAIKTYTSTEILQAYGATNLGVTGLGQNIAIIIDALPSLSDIAAFWGGSGISSSTTRLHFEEVNGPGSTTGNDNHEATIDVSWAGVIAPEAEITVYAVSQLNLTNLNLALDMIYLHAGSKYPSLQIVSISFGFGEKYIISSLFWESNSKLSKLLQSGFNIFVASGDHGAYGLNASGQPEQTVYFPASCPYVTSVGGTRLDYSGNTATLQETAWPYDPATGLGSGGGVSAAFPQPVWQQGPGVVPFANQDRQVPDVSLAADPLYGGKLVYNGVWETCGGTSWGTPIWAGFNALMNEARSNQGYPPLPPLNYFIYRLLGTNAFRDIITGNNGVYFCRPGYDLVTGLGSPVVSQLISKLNTMPYQVMPPGSATNLPYQPAAGGFRWMMFDYYNTGKKDLVCIQYLNTPNGCAQISVATAASSFKR